MLKKYKTLARKCRKSFNEKFYNKKRKCLYDVLGDERIRPNQLFAISLTYPVIEPSSEEVYKFNKHCRKEIIK